MTNSKKNHVRENDGEHIIFILVYSLHKLYTVCIY